MVRGGKKLALGFGFLLAFFLTANTAQAQRVDLNLVIAVDCSWSVNSNEYALQMGGVASAFSDPVVIDAIKSNPRGAIAVTMIHWSTDATQITVLPWTMVSDTASAISFAAQVANQPRASAKGGTSISGALMAGQSLLVNSPFRADRYVIDVIADGENNMGQRVETVRDQLVRQGTTINALAVVNEVSYLHFYLNNRVIGGPGSFVEKAKDYSDFTRAFRKKLLREIKGNPFSNVPTNRQTAMKSIPNP